MAERVLPSSGELPFQSSSSSSSSLARSRPVCESTSILLVWPSFKPVALADYNEAIRLDPKSALALSDRGVAYGNKGDYDRALADLNEAIRLDPKSAHAFRNRDIVYAYKGDYERAIADLNEAIRLNPK